MPKFILDFHFLYVIMYIEKKGFYDRINEGDEIVLESMPEAASDSLGNSSVIDNVPAADAEGNVVVKNDTTEILSDIRKTVERPSILELLRDIY